MSHPSPQQVSKFISLVLRHQPGKIGIESLEPGGYVLVGTLLEGLAGNGMPLSREELEQIVRESDKQRFSFDESGTRIRCNQGHSVPVDLQLRPAEPPAWLFHGTVAPSLAAIRREGLRPMSRHAVHLSPDEETAAKVGARRGRPVILRIDAARMQAEGHTFYRSDNGVWLVDAVPPEYIEE